MKVWDTKDRENLLCHIVPVYSRANDAVGLYDLVNEKFLPAKGSPFAASSYSIATNTYWDAADAIASTNSTVDLAGYDLTAATVATNASSAVAGSAYQDLEYIEATGSQAIQITDYKLPGTSKVELKFRPTAIPSSASQFLFCSRAGTSSSTYSCLLPDSGKLRFDFNNKQTYGTSVLSVAKDYALVFDGSTAKPTWSVNGITEATHGATSNGFTGGSDLFLFNNTIGGNYPAHCRLYYFRVTNGGEKELDLYPVRRLADGVAGLYDHVGGKFYPSSTNVAFTAGAEVGSLYTYTDGATIYVDAGSRTVKSNTPVVSWTTAPTNVSGLSFRLVTTGSDELRLSAKDDGLYLPSNGFMLIVR